MTDHIIIALLALLVLSNSRFGVRLMDWIVLRVNLFRKTLRRIINGS